MIASAPRSVPRPRPALVLLALLAVLAMPLLPVGPVAAQQSVTDPQALYDRMLRLERDLQAVQRNLYGAGGGPAQLGAQTGAGAGADIEASQAARLSLRLDQIEQSMRDLTGQIERMQFEVRQVNQRLDNFAADTDFRLRDLEGTGGGARPQAQAQSNAEPRLTPPSATPPAATPPDGERPLSAAQAATVGTLGTLSGGAAAAADRQSEPRQPAARGALPQGSADEAYSYAMSFLRQGDYGAAEAAFSQFLEAHGDTSLAGNAQYWLGETYYVREQYQDAARAFLTGYQTYASSPKAPDSLLKLGITLMALGQTQDGCITLSEVPRTFPNAPQSVKLRAEQERARAGCA